MDDKSSAEAGAIDVALTVAGLEVRSVHLEIASADGAVRRARDLNVSDSNATISALESGLVAGSYAINLSAKPAADDPSTAQDERTVECAGGVTGVQVVAGQTTDVNDLVLRCTLEGGRVILAGGIRLRATAQIDNQNECTGALIQDAFVGALATTIGTSVTLKGAVASGTTLAWTASVGSIAAPAGTETTFTCPAQPGVASVTLTATSGACTETAMVMVDCVGTGLPVCGNSAVEVGEACDDGNTVTESCSYGTASCQVCGAACQTVAAVGGVCGDGIVNGAEGCDGGANCTAQCTVSVPNPVCGNGVAEASETCDDGNTATESCSYGTASCQVCGSACQTVGAIGAYCGDGLVNGSEACDGSANCTAQCTVSVPNPVCGNGVAEASETCDDGNTVTESCSYGTASCQVCGAACQTVVGVGAYCGDGIVNGSEACDGSVNCTGQCTIVMLPTAVCGNNAVEAGEACDDGNAVTETCSYGAASCQVCDAVCQTVPAVGAYCGDGVVNGLEACDGGAQCSAQCTNVAPPSTVADRCEVCINQAQDVDFRNFNATQCNTDPLCVNVKRCLLNDAHDPNVAGKSCFNAIPAMCYCGITTDFGPCETQANFVAAGPCAADILAGLPASFTPQQVFQELTNTDYAAGRAYQIVAFAQGVCALECGFTQ